MGSDARLDGPRPLADDERDLLARVAAWPEHGSWTELTQPILARVAAERGIDFATALLYDRLRRSERHGPFIGRIDELVAQPPHFPTKIDVLLAIAPGACYREFPRTGGDGRRIREQAAAYGCRTALIPTESMGSVAENGRIIHEWLVERPWERILLVSLSKGAADIKAALARPGAETAFGPVVAWLNLSGLPGGTPMANWVFERKLATWFYRAVLWWQGIDIAMLREATWGPATVLDFPVKLPAHVRLISVAGFPLRRHLSRRALRRYHARLRPRGPNDGLSLLTDVCALPGLVYPVWAADHSLRPRWDVRRLVGALAFYLADTLDLWESESKRHGPGCATPEGTQCGARGS